MREATNGEYPKFAIWENVRGAFSSSKGEDFRCVLERFARIVEPDVSIPRPSGKNGKWAKSGAISGNGWSIAWRLFDAKYWGVAQRRQRIALVMDFGGQRASEILFERTSMSGDCCESIPAWKPLPELLKQALLDMIEWWNPGTLSQVVQKVKEQEGLEEKELDEYWSQTIERLRLDAQNLQPTL